MHVAGRSLGTAARDLARAAGGDERAESMLTRFHGIGAAQTRAQRLHHLRTFVALLRSNEIPLITPCSPTTSSGLKPPGQGKDRPPELGPRPSSVTCPTR